MVGGFQQGNDGHIYFVANNQTGATFNIQIFAASTDRNNSEAKTMNLTEASILGLLPHGDGIGREEIKFQLSMPMDSLRRGSVLKVTVLTIVLMLHFEGNIVQER